MSFAEKLREFRKENGISQEQLAEKCNVSRQAVSKWESGLGYPEMEKVLQLCDLLKVDLDYLMRDKIISGDNVISKQSNNIYENFVGKWVKIFLNDKEFQGLYRVAIIAANNKFVLFEQKSKKGVVKIADIKSMLDSDISKRKLESMKPIVTKEISEDYNPYEHFINVNCHIRLKCNSLFSSMQGYYNVKIKSVVQAGVIVEQKGKEIAIKVSDVLMIIEC